MLRLSPIFLNINNIIYLVIGVHKFSTNRRNLFKNCNFSKLFFILPFLSHRERGSQFRGSLASPLSPWSWQWRWSLEDETLFDRSKYLEAVHLLADLPRGIEFVEPPGWTKQACFEDDETRLDRERKRVTREFCARLSLFILLSLPRRTMKLFRETRSPHLRVRKTLAHADFTKEVKKRRFGSRWSVNSPRNCIKKILIDFVDPESLS